MIFDECVLLSFYSKPIGNLLEKILKYFVIHIGGITIS